MTDSENSPPPPQPEEGKGLRGRIAGLLLALSFLTRLPVPRWVHAGSAPLRIGPEALLLAGLLLGSLLALLAEGVLRFLPAFPPLLLALLLLFAWISLTGALHLDGVADIVECAYACVPPEEKRRIRKDPRKGVFGVLALILFVLSKGAGLLLAHPLGLALFLAPVIARSALPAVAHLLVGLVGRSLPEPGALGRILLEGGRVRPALVLLAGLLLSGLLAGGRGLAGAGAVVIGMAVLGRVHLGKVDGFSGDMAGFLVESGEILWLWALSL